MKYEGGQNTSVILESSEASSSYSAKLTVIYKTVTPIIKNGTYFMKTGASGNYMQIDDNDGPNYSTSGSIFELWEFDGEPYQKWNFTYLHNGYYKITSEKSGKAITVDSEEKDTDGTELFQKLYAGLERQQWKITKTSHGMYKIKARSSEGFSTDLCMAAGAGILTYDGRNVEQRKYVDDTNYKDEWIIESINPLLITLCGIYNSGHDHNSSLEACRPNLNRYGYNNIDYISGSISGMNCRSHLLNTNVFISRSHGCALTDSVSGALISTGIVLRQHRTIRG